MSFNSDPYMYIPKAQHMPLNIDNWSSNIDQSNYGALVNAKQKDGSIHVLKSYIHVCMY